MGKRNRKGTLEVGQRKGGGKKKGRKQPVMCSRLSGSKFVGRKGEMKSLKTHKSKRETSTFKARISEEGGVGVNRDPV